MGAPMKTADATDNMRRNLLLALGAGSIGAAAVAAPKLGLNLKKGGSKHVFSWWERLFVSLEHGSVSEWRGVVGQTFTIEGENGPVAAKLAELKLLPSAGSRPASCGRKQAFALSFETAAGQTPAGDRAYRVLHKSFPPLNIFVGAPSEAAKGMKLLAVFN